MPLARIVCRSDQDALPFVEGLREHGYAVELVRPDHSTERHCDLLLEVDSCSQKEAFSRANSFTRMYEDARILIAPGVMPSESHQERRLAKTPGFLAPALMRLIHRTGELKQWRVPVLVAVVVTFLAALPAIRRPASPFSLPVEQTPGFEQQLPFASVTIKNTPSQPPPPAQRMTPAIKATASAKPNKPLATRHEEPDVAEDEVIVRHFKSRVQSAHSSHASARVKHISDLD